MLSAFGGVVSCRVCQTPGRVQFVPVDDLQTTSTISALDWLAESVLVYMNAEYELVVFDTVALAELETVDISDLKLVYVPCV